MNQNLPLSNLQRPFSFDNNFEIKEVEESITNINVKNREELKKLFQNPKDHLTAYELNEENLQKFRKLRKYFFSNHQNEQF